MLWSSRWQKEAAVTYNNSLHAVTAILVTLTDSIVRIYNPFLEI